MSYFIYIPHGLLSNLLVYCIYSNTLTLNIGFFNEFLVDFDDFSSVLTLILNFIHIDLQQTDE